MEKLLHERLREFDRTENYGQVGCEFINDELRRKYGVSFIAKAMGRMAYEIERDYIPREQHEAEIKAIVEAQTNGGGYGCYSPHHIIKTYAEQSGIPMKEGECITGWMGRCQEFVDVRCFDAAHVYGEGKHLYNMHLTDTEIIRCRDCFYAHKHGKDLLCDWFRDASCVPALVKPDGFCAWAERDA